MVAGCRWGKITDLKKTYEKQPVCIEMFDRDNESHQAHVKRAVHKPSKPAATRVGSSSCSVAQWDFAPKGPYLNDKVERVAGRVRKLQEDGWEMPGSARYSEAHPEILQGAVSEALNAAKGARNSMESMQLKHPFLRQLHTGMTPSVVRSIVPPLCIHAFAYISKHAPSLPTTHVSHDRRGVQRASIKISDSRRLEQGP